jgi:hypothetical protein
MKKNKAVKRTVTGFSGYLYGPKREVRHLQAYYKQNGKWHKVGKII